MATIAACLEILGLLLRRRAQFTDDSAETSDGERSTVNCGQFGEPDVPRV